MGSRRGADEQCPEILAVEQVAPVGVDPCTGAGRQLPGPLKVEVADRCQLGFCHGIEYPSVLTRYPPGPDHPHPDDAHAGQLQGNGELLTGCSSPVR